MVFLFYFVGIVSLVIATGCMCYFGEEEAFIEMIPCIFVFIIGLLDLGNAHSPGAALIRSTIDIILLLSLSIVIHSLRLWIEKQEYKQREFEDDIEQYHKDLNAYNQGLRKVEFVYHGINAYKYVR